MALISNFNQSGKATQTLNAQGLSIAHPSLPITTQVWVVNIATGKEIEATVSGRIPASRDRIADLTPGIGRELALRPDSDIRIYTKTPPRER